MIHRQTAEQFTYQAIHAFLPYWARARRAAHARRPRPRKPLMMALACASALRC